MLEHEEAFVSAFIVPHKQARYSQLLPNPKRRRKLLDRLNHSDDVDVSKGTYFPHQQDAAELESLLRTRGAGETCMVIGNGYTWDGREVSLREVLDALAMDDGGVVVSCVPGRLALYRPEFPTRWWLLERE
jgi:hypothetical protein